MERLFEGLRARSENGGRADDGWCWAKNGVTSKLSKHLYIPTAARAKTSPPSHDRGSLSLFLSLGDGGVHDGETRREGQPERGPGAILATRRSERVLGGGERCGRSDGADGRRVVVVGNFNKSLLGSAFCSASQKKGAENRWAHFPGRGKRGCGGTRKLAPLKSWAVSLLSESQDGRRERSKTGGKVEADKSDHQALSCEKLPRP